ncbi:HTH-type transcriptional repressor ComR [bacterium YEK0313]|nr:HTH-type transcriptional repressor ComR [bacterium YEK0313]
MTGRGRPRKFDRQQALERAMQVFWARGYEGAQLAELTRAMGINPPSFYAAFGSKQAIFHEAVELYLGTAGARSMQALEETADSRTAIEAMLRASAAVALAAPGAGGCLLIVGLINAQPDSEPSRAYLQDLRRMTLARVRARLERGVSEGDLAPGTETAALAAFYATVMQGLSLQARDGATAEELDGIIAAAMRAFDGA